MDKFKELLIFVAGATPQIITETLYAFSQKQPPVFPDEIYIITSTTGRQKIEETLLKRGILKKMIKEYSLPEIWLNKHSFIIVSDSHGNELDDIRNEGDNEAVGDLITSFLRSKANDPSVRLRCSLAGGRKTMSFYMGAALQLFGRPWDKLYHVLVSPEFESNPEFFYKPKKDRLIDCRMADGTIKKLSTKDAKIELVELPFIRLGNKVSLQEKTFRDLVEEGQKEIDIATVQPEIRVNLSERTIHLRDNVIKMIPMQLLIYTTLLRLKKETCKHPQRPYCLECTDCYTSLVELSSRPALEKMGEYYRRIYRNQPLKTEELLNRWKEGIDVDVMRQGISKINRAIKEQLDNETLLPYYSITTVRKYADSRYGVRVEKGKIKIE